MSILLNGRELNNISDVLKVASKNCPNNVMLIDTKAGKELNRFSYKEGDIYAKRVATYFNNILGIKNERILLMLSNNSSMILTIFGCAYGDNEFVIGNSIQSFDEKDARMLANKINVGNVTAIITEKKLSEEFLDLVYDKLSNFDIIWISLEDILMHKDEIYSTKTERKSDDLAFIQFTSGTSNNPKGVCLTHKNFLYGIERVSERISEKYNNVMVSSLPLSHNMGLITVMCMFLVESTVVFMDVEEVLVKPVLWFTNMTKYKATFAGGINLFYINALKNVSEEEMLNLDLSHIHTAFIGGEEIKVNYLQMFINKFKKAGLRENSIFPGYGMTENTLLFSASKPYLGLEILSVDEEKLRSNFVEITDGIGKQLVSNGYIFEDDDVIVVNPDTLKRRVGELSIGELWISGPTVAKGYINNEEAEKEKFHWKIEGSDKEYLRTGDIGFIHNNRIFITGRNNDLIIIDGNNYYAQEFDTAIGNMIKSAPTGNIASFGEKDEFGNESLTIALGYRKDVYPNFDVLEKVSSDITNFIIGNYGIPVNKILYTEDKDILKTAIGKIKRNVIKNHYLKNEMKINYIWKDGSLYEKDKNGN